MAAFDFKAARRWARFDPGRTLQRRDDALLPFVADRESESGGELLLDTTVYIHQMQNRAPAAVERVIAARVLNHSIAAVQELMHSVGVLDPADPRTETTVGLIGEMIAGIPKHRILAPDAETFARAGLLAGILARLQGYGCDERLKARQDCLLFLQALKHGLTVLTANVREFDLLLQLLPAGRALFYRAGE